MRHIALLALQIGVTSVVALLALTGTGHAGSAFSAPLIASAAADAARSASQQSRAAAESAVRDIRDRLQAERRGAGAMARCGQPRTLAEGRACARAAHGRAYYH